MSNPKKEAQEAKKAVAGFVSAVFRPDSGFEQEEFNRCFRRIKQFAVAVPLPDGRIAQGKAIDYLASSFWHACCAVLDRWLHSRIASSDGTGNIIAYRGQANPWPIRPTLWRSGALFSGLGAAPLNALRSFLLSSLPEEPDPTFEYFSHTSDSGVAAIAQHHGFPTNLVDFSFHPLVALFFASRESPRADLGGDRMEGHGVIFECEFSNFGVMSQEGNMRHMLELAPPIHVARLYQQQGFFVDCGAVERWSQGGHKQDWQEVDWLCERIYFPREYPSMNGADDVFSDELMIRRLGHEHDPWYSPQTNALNSEWYFAYPFYARAFQGLRDYCERNPGKFDGVAAESAMRRATRDAPRPWESFSRTFGTRFRRGQDVAEHLATAARFVCDAANVYTQDEPLLDKSIVSAYAEANPTFFSALHEIGQRMELYGLPEMCRVIFESLGESGGELIAKGLTDEQRRELRKIPPMHHLD